MKKHLILIFCCMTALIVSMAQPKMQNTNLPERFNKEKILERNLEKPKPNLLERNQPLPPKQTTSFKSADWWEPDTVYLYSLYEFTQEEPYFRTIMTYRKDKQTTLHQEFDWIENEWINFILQTWLFDENNNLLERLFQKWEAGQWVNIDIVTQKYDTQNNCTEWIGQFWENGQWINSEKSKATYDERNNCLEYTSYDWDGEDWRCNYKRSYQYDENNNCTEQIAQSIVFLGGELVYFDKTSFDYDPQNNNLMKESNYKWEAGDWVYNYKKFYQYDLHNNLKELIAQEANWETGELENVIKNSYSYNEQNKMTNWLQQIWKSADWVNSWRDTYTYIQGNLIEILAENWEAEQWTNPGKEIFVYDTRNNITENAYLRWKSEQWVYDYYFYYDFDAHNNLTAAIIQYPDESGQLVNDSKSVYTFDDNNNSIAAYNQVWKNNNWIYAEAYGMGIYYNNMKNSIGTFSHLYRYSASYVKPGELSIKGSVIKNDTKLYPNPTTGKLTIDNEQLTIQNIEIFDISGRKIYYQSTNENTSLNIDISHVVSGVYFVKIATTQGEVVKKVVKQ